MALKITKNDLDFVTSSIVLVVMTPFLIMFGIGEVGMTSSHGW